MPSSWKRVAFVAVGGLTEVGFAGSFLLVVSHQGRGVVDLASGERVTRDRHETGAWFDAARGTALAIGPLEGIAVEVIGLAGGQLPGRTEDGWRADAHAGGVTVSAPGAQPLEIDENEELRAFGFSPDGSAFIVATPSGVLICRGDEGCR